MKKEKLKLNDLAVNSFVTELSDNENKTVDGGAITVTPTLISATIVSYRECRTVGEDLGQVASDNLCGDSFGFVCKILTV